MRRLIAASPGTEKRAAPASRGGGGLRLAATGFGAGRTDNPVAAGLLGGIEIVVGAVDGAQDVRVFRVRRGDAQAGGEIEHTARMGDRDFGERGANLLGHQHGVFDRRLGQDDGELLAAHAAEHVGAAQVLQAGAGQRPDHLVADGVAVGVVDILEAVDVEHDDAEVRVVAPVAFQFRLAEGEETAPVVAAGEGVGAGEVDQFLGLAR